MQRTKTATVDTLLALLFGPGLLLLAIFAFKVFDGSEDEYLSPRKPWDNDPRNPPRPPARTQQRRTEVDHTSPSAKAPQVRKNQAPPYSFRYSVRLRACGYLIRPPATFWEGHGVITLRVKQIDRKDEATYREAVYVGSSVLTSPPERLECLGISHFGAESLASAEEVVRELLNRAEKAFNDIPSIPFGQIVKKDFLVTIDSAADLLMSNPNIAEFKTFNEFFEALNFDPLTLQRIATSPASWRKGSKVS